MKRKLAGPQLDMTINRVFPQAKDHPLGVELECHFIKENPTDQQREGFHWLLGEWLSLDPGVAKNTDALKTQILKAKFGVAKVTDPHGNEFFIPLRRTTAIFDWDIPGYRRKKLSKALYIELIDYTYNMASEDGVILPVMKKDHAA